MSEEKKPKGFGFKIKLSKDDSVHLPIRYLSDSCKNIWIIFRRSYSTVKYVL